MKGVGKYSISYLIISVLIISMMITGTTIFMSDVVTEYGVAGVENYSSISKLEEMSNDVSDMSGTLQNTTADPSIVDYAKGIASGAWGTVSLTFNSINIMSNMTTETVEAQPFSIGSWFILGIMGVLTVIVVFTILGAVFQRDI